MPSFEQVLKSSAWVLYAIIVFEILFMISPIALYFYSVYGPVLQAFNRSEGTAWLTQFFLPHISKTTSPLLNLLSGLAWPLILLGTGLFLGAAIPLYFSKIRRQGAVTKGLYRYIRHPQYLALAILGLGTLLLWPRFLVLITYVTMLFLYSILGRWEEAQCLARYGESYHAYLARTGRFLPLAWSQRLPRLLPTAGGRGITAPLGFYALLLGASVALGFGLREYSLSHLTAWYTDDTAVLSPAILSDEELRAAYRTATTDIQVQKALEAVKPAKRIIYVVPLAWCIPDLPLEATATCYGHHVPANFDRRYYKLLFTQTRTHAAQASRKEIVKTAYGLHPIVLVKVDISATEVTEVETPPPHVFWGDIPTPMY
jgi:Putative protein-S-isoprenylcysteine methyltransferase